MKTRLGRKVCDAAVRGMALAGALAIGGMTTARADSATWNVNATGMWTNPANWTAAFPNGIDQIAAFTNGVSAARHITNDVAITLGGIIFGDTLSAYNAFQLVPAGSGSFTFDVSSGYALISKRVSTALDTNRVNITLNDDLMVSNATTAVLTLIGRIDGAGRTVVLDSPGGTGVGRTIFQGSNTYSTLTIRNGASFYGKSIYAAGGADITVENGGQFYMETAGTSTNALAMSGDGWVINATIGALGALRLGNTTYSGPITLNGDTRIAAYGTSGTVSSVLSGPRNLTFGYTGADTTGGRITLTGDNSYGDTTIETNQELRIGGGGTTGSLGTGTVTNWGRLTFERSDDLLLTNVIIGTGALQKRGTGTLTITNEMLSSTAGFGIIAGAVAIAADGSLGTGQIEFAGNATLRSVDAGARVLTNALLLTSGFTTAGAGDITFLGAVNNGAGAKFLTISNALTTVLGPLSNTGTIGKRGPGQLVLGSAMNVSAFTNLEGLVTLGAGGVFTNAAATLTLLGGTVLDVSAATNAFTVGAAQVLRGSGSVVGDATVTGLLLPGSSPGTLSFSNHLFLADATLEYDLGSAGTPGGGVNDLVAVTSNLTATGVSTVNVASTTGSFAPSYTLVTYGGALGGNAGNFAMGASTNNFRQTFTLNDATPGEIRLVPSAATGLGLTWSGGANSLWDVRSSTNWNTNTEVFYPTDGVTFDDTALFNPTVTLAGTVFPYSISVVADMDYTFNGVGRISGGTGLTKGGAGMLTLGTTNDFTGEVVVTSGILRVASPTALGTSAGATRILPGATLDVNGTAMNAGLERIVVAGSGVGGTGVVVNTGAQQTSALAALALAGDATIAGGVNRWDVRGPGGSGTYNGLLDLGGYTLTKIGTNDIGIVDVTATNDGNLVVAEGMLRMSRSNVSGAGVIGVASNAVLYFENYTVGNFDKAIALSNGVLRSNSNTTNGSPITLVGAGFFDVTGNTLILTNSIGGTGQLIKTNAGTLRLAAPNTYAGGTVISNGIINVQNDTALGPGGVTIASAGASARLVVGGGVNITNALVIEGGPGVTGRGPLEGSAGATGTYSGPITILATMGVGGHIHGQGGLVLAGPLTSSVPVNVRNGLVFFANNVGNCYTNLSASGSFVLRVSDGVPTNAYVVLGSAGTTPSYLDLSGFDQSLASLTKGASAAVVVNTAATPSTLTLAIDGATNCVFDGVLSNNVNLVKTGAGPLTLTAASFHTGVTSVREGVMVVQNRNALQNSTVSNTVANGIEFTNSTSYVFGGLAGSADLVLTTRQGTAITLIVGRNDEDTSYSGVLGGTGSMVKMGAGALTLNSAQAYAGGTILSNGVVRVAGDNWLGTGTLTLSGGGLSSDGAAPRTFTNAVLMTVASTLGDPVRNGLLTFTGPADLNGGSRSLTNFSDVVFTGGSSNGRIAKRGPGQLTLQGVHVWNGDAAVFDGTLILDGAILTNSGAMRPTAEIPGGLARLVLTNGASLVLSGNSNVRAGYQAGDGTQTNIVDVAGTIRMPNADVNNGRVMLGSTSARGELNLLPGGDLEVNYVMGGDQAPNGESVFNFMGGILRPRTNQADWIRSITAASVRSGGAVIDTSGFDAAILQALVDGGGGGGLTKQGAGVLRLMGTNTYAGATRVVTGLLSIEASGSINRSAVLQIDAGAAFAATGLVATMHLATNQTLKGHGTFVGGLIADAGSTVAPGTSTGTLTVEGALTLEAGSTFAVELQAPGDYDRLVFSGASAALTLNSPELLVALLAGYTPALNDKFLIVTGLPSPVTTTFNNKPDDSEFIVSGTTFRIDYNDGNDISLTVVPEPSTLGLAGALGLVVWLRRRLRA